jgi:hypothetical protein
VSYGLGLAAVSPWAGLFFGGAEERALASPLADTGQGQPAFTSGEKEQLAPRPPRATIAGC